MAQEASRTVPKRPPRALPRIRSHFGSSHCGSREASLPSGEKAQSFDLLTAGGHESDQHVEDSHDSAEKAWIVFRIAHALYHYRDHGCTFLAA
eukprot:4883958-Pyramimonas_sp.AAC.1